ncbi:unnamed protein product [Owenia fusiformis]|uniref:3-deoxy-7-phosphoheptulonate synthase n=1 Tax=Owenia fusiformis TaxID=6347 RepID=A0A8J1XGX9_OWEFU|nr:unnamed protein product [Owenia fusiformis]
MAILESVMSVQKLKNLFPLSQNLKQSILEHRRNVENILKRENDRRLVIVGPCSIHNVSEAMDYARKLKKIKDRYSDTVMVIMRVYLEKPRTLDGWKGFLNDPDLDGTFNVNKGLTLGRKLLVDINKMGVPCATEFLDPLLADYFSDLITWGCIGARTTESQIHKQMVSGLRLPVGFKNTTSGDVTTAILSTLAVQKSFTFVKVMDNGKRSLVQTEGNPNTFLVLRGSTNSPNYTEKDIRGVEKQLADLNTKIGIIIDCSHGNSGKDFRKQPSVCKYVADKLINAEFGNFKGVMIESNIIEGCQNTNKPLKYGISVTDSCVNLETTEKMIETLSKAVAAGYKSAVQALRISPK